MSTSTTLGRGAAIAARAAFSWRGLAFVAGLVLLSGTLAILFYDVVALGSAFTLKHYITLAILAGTLLLGILAEQSLHRRKWGSSAGFWLLFLVGTGLVIYSSVGRQGEKALINTAVHDSDVAQRLDLQAQIKTERLATAEKRKAADKACEKRLPEHVKCAGPRATQAVYEASVKGLEARLTLLAPPKPVDAEAETFADTAAAMGANRAAVLAMAGPFYRYLVTLFFEFGTIWCFARAFGPERSARSDQPVAGSDKPTTLGAVTDAELSELRANFTSEAPKGQNGGLASTIRRPNGPKGPKGGAQRLTHQEIIADLMLRAVTGQTFGSNDETAQHYGYSASRFSELVSRWEAAGLIPKSRMVGRYKEIASVASAEA